MYRLSVLEIDYESVNAEFLAVWLGNRRSSREKGLHQINNICESFWICKST